MKFPIRVRGRNAFFIADQTDDLGVGFFQLVIDVTEQHAGGFAAFGDARLGQVGAGFKSFGTGTFARRNKETPDKNDKGQTGQGDGNADRAVIKH